MRIDIAGVGLDNHSKQQVLAEIKHILETGQRKYLVTVYSEFIVFASKDEGYRKVLNEAYLSLPDGIGILWAAKFLSLPAVGNKFLKFVQVIWQAKYSLLATLFWKKYISTVIREKVTGSKLIWDLAQLASENDYSLALVGGEDSVAAQTAYELKKIYPVLKVNLAMSGGIAFNDNTVAEIAASNSDILLIAYQPPKQEKWLAENLGKLNVKLAIGLGGTFDYVSGRRTPAPPLLYNLGLEWFWRLITQPWRWKRIWNAIPVFIWVVIKYKLTKSSPT